MEALSVQAESAGLHVHQMAGFDTDAARQHFGLTGDLVPVVVVAIGLLDADAVLPDALAAREQAPRTRTPLPALLLSGSRTGRRAA